MKKENDSQAHIGIKKHIAIVVFALIVALTFMIGLVTVMSHVPDLVGSLAKPWLEPRAPAVEDSQLRGDIRSCAEDWTQVTVNRQTGTSSEVEVPTTSDALIDCLKSL